MDFSTDIISYVDQIFKGGRTGRERGLDREAILWVEDVIQCVVDYRLPMPVTNYAWSPWSGWTMTQVTVLGAPWVAQVQR